ncbi:MAG: class I SAM-dependent methyltransferase [Flavipsychrobacter sp.]
MANKVKELFNSWAGAERGERMAAGHDVLVEHILQLWKGDDIEALLDVGCGNGRALTLAKAIGAKHLIGVDLSDKMIETAKQNLPEAQFYNTPMQELHMLADNSCSHIMSIEALYYLQQPIDGLKELSRVLMPDGKIAIAIDFYKESIGTHSWSAALGFELSLLSADEWVALFHEAGFKGVTASRIHRTENIKTEEAFDPSPFFTSYAMYQDYINAGALLLSN